MAKASSGIIETLRSTAKALETSTDYQWGHMGSCNCGFLARQISRKEKKEIHQYAMQKNGDWSEQLNDYCAGSGLLMDELITLMLDAGFDADDLKHLERLSDPYVLGALPDANLSLRHNVKQDVILYLKVWANVLEAKMLEAIVIRADTLMPAEV